MGNVKRKPLIQRKVTRASNVVWKMLKCYVATLEDEDDDLDDNNFYMPPTSPSESISEKIGFCMQADCGVWSSKILLATHENTMHKV